MGRSVAWLSVAWHNTWLYSKNYANHYKRNKKTAYQSSSASWEDIPLTGLSENLVSGAHAKFGRSDERACDRTSASRLQQDGCKRHPTALLGTSHIPPAYISMRLGRTSATRLVARGISASHHDPPCLLQRYTNHNPLPADGNSVGS
jgi:hypothetical protein